MCCVTCGSMLNKVKLNVLLERGNQVFAMLLFQAIKFAT